MSLINFCSTLPYKFKKFWTFKTAKEKVYTAYFIVQKYSQEENRPVVQTSKQVLFDKNGLLMYTDVEEFIEENVLQNEKFYSFAVSCPELCFKHVEHLEDYLDAVEIMLYFEYELLKRLAQHANE